MGRIRNILFVMCDQLRWDYLSCYGNRLLQTPHIDSLAIRGVRFTRAYVQSPVCGPSRMSFYTGRYVFSHGATWNFVPLPVGERTLGHYLQTAGLRTAVVGKTHFTPDTEGMDWLGLASDDERSRTLKEGGFDPFARDDGIHPNARGAHQAYNEYLSGLGYPGENPWHDFANSGVNPDGVLASGWLLRNSHLMARIPDEHSETAWSVDRAIDFIKEQGEKPWCLHLSFIKPHWPYIASAPYHTMYGSEESHRPVRSMVERNTSNPIFRGFQEHIESRSFSLDNVRRNVIPAYMGLIKQIDDHIGRLLAHLETAGRMDDTLIVFTSDHGDYLGDHWMGEKEFMYEQGVRVPLIIVDPSADALKGATCDALVEAIDLVPTLMEAMGLEPPSHILEGASLMPFLRHRQPRSWREAVFSELDYAIYPTARELGLSAREARMVMARTTQWKLVYFGKRFPPQLFNLNDDPEELSDLGADPSRQSIREDLTDLLFDWMRSRRNRIAMSDAAVDARPSPAQAGGVIIGQW